jgi:hypothetical protein
MRKRRANNSTSEPGRRRRGEGLMLRSFSCYTQASSQGKADDLIRDWLDRNKPSPWLTALWFAAFASVVGMFIFLPENSFDLRVSSEAMHYLRMGVDPYAASIARQKAEAALGHHKGEAALGHRVFVYLYPPISIELLKVLNMVPALLRAAIFWMVYAVGFGLQLWAGSRFALAAERRMLRFVFPLVMFFPAFVPSDTLLSGNIAIPMYGAVLAAAVRGWREERWGVFFAVVVATSLLKPPMLVWLAVPVLLGCAQLAPAVAAALCGVGLFAIQKFLWAQRFAEFMSSIRYTLPLEINYSTVAMFGKFLEFIGHPSDRAAVAFYIAVSLAMFGILMYFAREFRRKNVAGQNFAAVVLVSTALFAPRLKEYDLLPLTIPMALIVLRGVRSPVARIVLILGAVAVGVALITDRLTAVDIISVATVFMVGVHGLNAEAQASRALRAREEVAIPQAIRV